MIILRRPTVSNRGAEEKRPGQVAYREWEEIQADLA